MKKKEIDKVKPGDWVPVSILAKIMEKREPVIRDYMRLFGLKSKNGFGLRNKKCIFFEFLSITKYKKIISEKTNWDDAKIEAFVKSLKRAKFSETDKKIRDYNKKLPKVIPSPGKGSVPQQSEEPQDATEFAFQEADDLGCCPRKYNKSVRKAVASGYYQTA